MKIHRTFFVIFYLLFSLSILCETGCEPDCDPSVNMFTMQIEECEHPSCELSHKDQHNYIKDDGSDSFKTFKILKDGKTDTQNFEIVYLDALHLNKSTQILLNNTETHYYPNRKRYVVFQRLKVFNS